MQNLKYYLLLFAVLSASLFFFLKYKSVANDAMDLHHAGITRGDVEAIVKETINSNPELIINSMRKWSAEQEKHALKEVQQRVEAQKSRFENNINDPRIGNPQGAIKIVALFDHACGYCQRMLPIEEKIVANNKDVLLIYKPFPILGEGSVLAARAEVAAYKLDPAKFGKLHAALFNQKGERTPESILDLAGAAGYNVEEFRNKLADAVINQTIEETRSAAREVGISSTPTFIINGKLIPGSMSFEELSSMVEAARKELPQSAPATVPALAPAPVVKLEEQKSVGNDNK